MSLKIARVNPILFKVNPHELSTYGPISILPSISKFLDKIIYNRFYTFLDNFHFLNLDQYGFRKGHSTDQALVQLYDKITNAMVNGQHVIGVLWTLIRLTTTFY